MNDEVKPQPVDNSHRDANVAARESKKETSAAAKSAESTPKQEAKADMTQDDAASDQTEQDESQNTTEQSADSESGDAPAQQSRRKPGVHQRIDELTKARYDAERERDHWREQAMRQSQPPEPQAPAAAQASDEPTLESCDFDQVEFQRKWYSWRRNEDKKVETAQARVKAFTEKESAFRAAHPDYDAVARNPALPITQQVAEIILETDDPPAIAYYLGQNPSEAAAIAQMTPHQIGRAIGRIEAKLSAPPTASDVPRQPEPKTVTRAPPPVTTLSGAPTIKKDIDSMSMAEYDAHRRAERKAKGLSP